MLIHFSANIYYVRAFSVFFLVNFVCLIEIVLLQIYVCFFFTARCKVQKHPDFDNGMILRCCLPLNLNAKA